MLNKSIK